MNVAVIPARGGSKRIPRKNIAPFGGRPMMAHSIECARTSGLFDRILVSTDNSEIAAVARQYGAEVPFVRPAELSDDHAGTVAVIAHAVRWLQAGVGPIEAVCCIYATAPFMRAADLAAGLALLRGGNVAFAFSATTYAFPIFRSFGLNDDGGVAMFFPDNFATRSQDLPEALHDAGQFYWARPQTWLAGEPVFGARSRVVSIPRWRVQDIDTAEDWTRAEIMWRMMEAQPSADR